MNKTAYQYSITLLTKKDYSIHKLTDKLISKKFLEEEIEETIKKLTDQRYLREETYTENLILSCLRKNQGNLYIKRKLENENLNTNDEIINNIREEYKISSESQIKALIIKKTKYSELPTSLTEKLKIKTKLMNYLLSKGHDGDEIQYYIQEILKL